MLALYRGSRPTVLRSVFCVKKTIRTITGDEINIPAQEASLYAVYSLISYISQNSGDDHNISDDLQRQN